MRMLRTAALAIGLSIVALPPATAPFGLPGVSLLARGPLAQLRGMAELKGWFNGYKGRPRLILLLSPT